MKVLLIQMPGRELDWPVVPIGLCYISDALSRADHVVTIYDPNVSKTSMAEDLKDLSGESSFDFIGLSLRNIDNNHMDDLCYYYENFGPILTKIHQQFPDSKIIIGGPGFSIFAEVIMQRNPLLDYGIYQQGTDSVVELLENLDNPGKVAGVFYRKKEEVVFSGPRPRPDLNKLPTDPWKLIDLKKYMDVPFKVGVLSKTGCVFKCSYCTYPRLTGGKVSIRSPKLIVDDIEVLVKKYGINEFFFLDSMFNYPQNAAITVCQEIVRRKLKVNWSAYFIEKYFTKEIMDWAMKAGCHTFSFSPDGIDNKTMIALGKENREEDLYRVYKLIKETEGVTAGFSFFLNPPEQDFIGFLKSVKFFLMTKILNRKKFKSCSFWYPRVYPNTPLHELAVKQGLMPEKAEDLLPRNKEDLYKLFYINPENSYLNFLYRNIVTPFQTRRKRLRFEREMEDKQKLQADQD